MGPAEGTQGGDRPGGRGSTRESGEGIRGGRGAGTRRGTRGGKPRGQGGTRGQRAEHGTQRETGRHGVGGLAGRRLWRDGRGPVTDAAGGPGCLGAAEHVGAEPARWVEGGDPWGAHRACVRGGPRVRGACTVGAGHTGSGRQYHGPC